MVNGFGDNEWRCLDQMNKRGSGGGKEGKAREHATGD